MQLESFSHARAEKAIGGDQINLIEAQHAFAIVELQYRNSNDRFQSTILSVDPAAQIITVDETFPAGFHVARGVPIDVTLRLARGRRKTFTTLVVGTQQHRSGSTRYQLAMPNHLTYMQRRESYRFKLNGATAFAEFKTPGDYYCSGTVLDISLTGLRMLLDQAVPVQAGAQLESFEFNFSHQQFNCSARVQNIGNHVDERFIIGVAFNQMPRAQERALEKTLIQLHRKIARQNTETHFAVVPKHSAAALAISA